MIEDDPTGGLTLDPPEERAAHDERIAFAPDLDANDAQAFAALEADPRILARAPTSSLYPRAVLAIARLLGDAASLVDDAAGAKPSSDRGEPLALGVVGPAITRAPPPMVRPRERARDDERTVARPGSEALMEMLLVGRNQDGAREAHLQFQDDVMGGMYLHLERRDDGLFLRFVVGDDGDRRTLAAYVDELVARFEKKGTRVAGYEIVVGVD